MFKGKGLLYDKTLLFMGKTIEKFPFCVKGKGPQHMWYYAKLEF